MSVPRTYKTYPPSSLARVLQILLAVAGATALIAGAWEFAFLRAGTFVLHVPEATRSSQPPYWTGSFSGESAGAFPALLWLPSLAVQATVVMWLIWQYQATSNLWARRYDDLSIRPGWAVGWWFIPFANWAMPLVAVLELEKRSTPEGSPRRASPLIGAWWVAWLAYSIVPAIGIVGAVLSALNELVDSIDRSAPTIDFSDAAHAIAPWLLVSGILQAIAAGLAIAVVHRIDAHQREMMAAEGPAFVATPIRPDVG